MTIGDVILQSWSVAWRIALTVVVLQTILALVVSHCEGFPVVARIPIDRAISIGFLAAAVRYQSAIALGIGCALAGADLCMVIHYHVEQRHDAARSTLTNRLLLGDWQQWVALRALVADLSPIDQLFVMYWIARGCQSGIMESHPTAKDRRFRLTPPSSVQVTWPDPPGAT